MILIRELDLKANGGRRDGEKTACAVIDALLDRRESENGKRGHKKNQPRGHSFPKRDRHTNETIVSRTFVTQIKTGSQGRRDESEETDGNENEDDQSCRLVFLIHAVKPPFRILRSLTTPYYSTPARVCQDGKRQIKDRCVKV